MLQNKAQNDSSRHWSLVMLLPNHAPGLSIEQMLFALEKQGISITATTLMEDLVVISKTVPLAKKMECYGMRWWIDFPVASAQPESSSRLPQRSARAAFAR